MAKKKATHLPVYTESFEYAYAHDECLRYNASHDANVRCKEAIERAIASHRHDYCLDCKSAVREVVKQFGYERMFYVLANTVQLMDWDGRISRDNINWAKNFPTSDKRSFITITRNHPGLVNMFAKEARHNYLLTQPLKARDVTAEAEKILSQFQNLREPNSPGGEQFMVQVSPDFLEHTKSKNMERLMSLLPFPSLKISRIEGRIDTYAMIDKCENRWQPLQKRKPSIKAQLAAKPVPGDQSARPKDREAR